MTNVLVVAPHPDDETLGCGGTLLRHVAEGDQVHWLIMTAMAEDRYPTSAIDRRQDEIKALSRTIGFTSVHTLGLPTATLDALPLADIIGRMAEVIGAVQPAVVYAPYRGDAHSDHAVTFDACKACMKWFRYPSVRSFHVYETISETDFSPGAEAFSPNRYVDITDYLDRKIEALNIFASEMGAFPFPRSEQTVRALAALRGSQCGASAAEAFMTLREIVR